MRDCPALRHENTVDYLTKPLDFTLFEKTLKDVYNNYFSIPHFDSFDEISQRMELFSDIIFGSPNDIDNVTKQLKNLGISPDNHCYSLVNIRLNNFTNYLKNVWKHDTINFYFAICNLIPFNNNSVYSSLVRYCFGNLQWIIIHPKDDNTDIINFFYEKLRDNIKDIFNLEIKMINYVTYNSLSELLNFNTFSKNDQQNNTFSKDNEFTNIIFNYVEENYSKNITLEAVSKQVFMSPTYFSAYFKKVTNQKFIDYLTDLRLKKACELLKNNNLSVTNICQQVGYSHLGHFYDIFKKHYGMTPVEYRKSNLG